LCESIDAEAGTMLPFREKKYLSITHGLHIKMMHIAAKSDSVEELKKTKGVFPKVVP
jgi:hypothetical protein